jgi:ABC-type antimicrobial peptide transport system permease subunit
MTVMVRGRGSPDETRRLLEGVLARRTNQGERVFGLQEAVDFTSYPQRAASWLSMLLGGIALLLTATGIYGVMSYLVSQRTKEFGIRIALGATRAQVARFTLSFTMRLVTIGLALGAVLALGASQYAAAAVGPMIDFADFPAYALGFIVVALAGLAAAVGPTLRASRVDPIEVLRAD